MKFGIKDVGIALFIVSILAIVYYGNYRVTSTTEYQAALKYIDNSAEIKHLIGDVQKISFISGGHTLGQSNRSAGYEYEVQGKVKQARMQVWVFKSESCDEYMVSSNIQYENEDKIVFNEICQL
ncbi:MAG: hypothetical protein COA99_19730 [Moraxellaceae bacterium]|nr:MAG: hypothetical protein COA99_19730 [Moraxellaceae bacterium]